ncbi:hypothetical protein MTO96_046561 [Rhipicephalus appendiculatus]
MLETLSLCLIVGGIYVLLLLIIVEGWLLVWHYFLCRLELVRELLADDLTAGPKDFSGGEKNTRNAFVPLQHASLI